MPRGWRKQCLSCMRPANARDIPVTASCPWPVLASQLWHRHSCLCALHGRRRPRTQARVPVPPANYRRVHSCFLRLPRKPLDGGAQVMSEMRTYKTKPGMRSRFLEIFRSKSIPAHAEIGMKILGPFLSVEDPDTFFFMRGFPDFSSREPMKAKQAESLCSSDSAALILKNVHSPVTCGLNAVRRTLFSLYVTHDDRAWPAKNKEPQSF